MSPARSTVLTLLLGVLLGLALAVPAGAALPPVGHVFVVVLENENEATAFPPSNPPSPALSNLRTQGVFIPNYYGIGHASLDNYIAMISGQPPNPSTKADCGVFASFPTPSLVAGIEQGSGCVYPADVPSLPQQLKEKGLTWRSYDEGMGTDPVRDNTTGGACGHPVVGQPDVTEIGQDVPPYDEYATRHNPFVYFDWLIDKHPADCNQNVVPLTQLSADLAVKANTANYTFITPDLCSDGHDLTCRNSGRSGGFAGIDNFLTQTIPVITASPAYQQDGMLIVLFDESAGDAGYCCGTNTAAGGATGAVVLSPLIDSSKLGATTSAAYNHYGMLATVEDLFGVSRLACAAAVPSFGADVFGPGWAANPATTSPACGYAAPPTTTPTTPTTPNQAPPAPPSCSATVLPKSPHGRLGANTLIRAVAVSHGALTLTGGHASQLTVIISPSHRRSRTRASRTLLACHAYSFRLPRGHGHITLTATVGRASQTVTKSY